MENTDEEIMNTEQGSIRPCSHSKTIGGGKNAIKGRLGIYSTLIYVQDSLKLAKEEAEMLLSQETF